MQTPVVPIFEVGEYDEHVDAAVQLLRDGGVVVLPTETVYGAAGLLRHSRARERLHALPPSTKPLTLHLADRHGAAEVLGQVGEIGQRMMKKLWPGPVAMIFDVPEARRKEVAGRMNVDEGELYDGSQITLRCPDHVVAGDVIALAAQEGSPVVMVRAGVSSNQPAYRADQVAADLDGKVDLILDGGPSRYSKPSTILKVRDNGYEIVRSGVYDQRIIERLMRTTILFVCSGNTCRSPMAEAIARRVLSEMLGVPETDLEKKGISVMSAGSMAMPGSRATAQGVEAVREFGADLSRHRSRPLSVELIHQADMIYAMSHSHMAAVMSLVPSAMEKVQMLAGNRDIDDPIGGELAQYQTFAREMRQLIEARLKESGLV